MGRHFLVEFEETDPNFGFYLCRTCQTPVASHKDYTNCFAMVDTETGGIFKKVVNVIVDEPAQFRYSGPHTVADVYCTKCGYNLGWKFVKVPEDDPVFAAQMFYLCFGKVLLKDRCGIVHAETMEPFEGNA